MRSLVFAVILSFSSFAAFAAEVASVNFDAIKDDLRKYYLAKPENAKLKKQLEEAAKEEKKQMENMQKMMRENTKSIDLSEIMAMGEAASRFELENEMDADLKKELYVIISGLGLKYDLIYDSSDTEAIIYSKTQINDVTPAVKQAIIDFQKKK